MGVISINFSLAEGVEGHFAKMRAEGRSVLVDNEGREDLPRFKNDISIGWEHQLVLCFEVMEATVHDSQVFDDLLDPKNSSKEILAGLPYRFS